MRYREADVYRFLFAQGCSYEGDTFAFGTGWFTKDFHVFSLPAPDADPATGDKWFDAAVIDFILADRWIWSGPSRIPSHE